MELRQWVDQVDEVSAGYGEYYGVERTPEWVLLKLTEEVGELTQAWLALSGQGRDRGKSTEQLRADLEGELADALAMVLVMSRRVGVDVEEALERKWLPWADFHRRRRAGEDVAPPVPTDGPDRSASGRRGTLGV